VIGQVGADLSKPAPTGSPAARTAVRKARYALSRGRPQGRGRV